MIDRVAEECARHVLPHGCKDAVIASGLFAKLRIANGQLHSTTASRAFDHEWEFAAPTPLFTFSVS